MMGLKRFLRVRKPNHRLGEESENSPKKLSICGPRSSADWMVQYANHVLKRMLLVKKYFVAGYIPKCQFNLARGDFAIIFGEKV